MSCKDEQWRPDSMILTMLIRAWKNKYVFFLVLRIPWWPENLQHSNPSHCAKAVTKSEMVTKIALILQQKNQLFLSWQPAQVDTSDVAIVLSKRKLRAHNMMHSVKSLLRRDCFSSDPCGRQQNSSDPITKHTEARKNISLWKLRTCSKWYSNHWTVHPWFLWFSFCHISRKFRLP